MIWARLLLGSLAWLGAASTLAAAVRFVPGERYQEVVAAAIDGAESSVEVMLYAAVLPEHARRDHPVRLLLEALAQRAAAGVEVRVLLEDGTGLRGRRDPRNDRAAAWLRSAGVDVRYDPPERRLHAKSIAVDGRLLVVGSTNWSMSAMRYNREHALVTDDADAVRAFRSRFIEAWADAGPPPALQP